MVWVDWSDRRTGSVSNKKAWRDRVIRVRFRDTPSDGALVLCRGQRVGAASILVVMSRDPREGPADIRRLEHENSLARLIDSAWALRPLGLSRQDGRTFLSSRTQEGFR